MYHWMPAAPVAPAVSAMVSPSVSVWLVVLTSCVSTGLESTVTVQTEDCVFPAVFCTKQ